MMTTDRTFYTEHLKASVLPFWERAFDDEAGGLFTCWTNDGKTLISTDKYTWSQARMLWCLSYMLVNLALEENQHNRYRTRAGQLYDLLRGAILPGPDEGCAFLLTREGEAKEPIGGSGLYTSLYADCFVAIAFARWAVAAKEMGILEEALAVHGKTMALIERGIIKTEPYPLPAGSEAQGVLMILCHTATELSLALAHVGDGRAAEYRGEAQAHAHCLLDHFVDRDSMQLKEVVVQEGRQTTLLERHRNPGHTVECMWFLLDALGGKRLQEIETILITALELGWDEEYGGSFATSTLRAGGREASRGRTPSLPWSPTPGTTSSGGRTLKRSMPPPASMRRRGIQRLRSGMRGSRRTPSPPSPLQRRGWSGSRSEDGKGRRRSVWWPCP